MRAIIQRFPSAPDSEPVPVVRVKVVPIRFARGRPLPQVPIEPSRNRHFFAGSDRFPDIGIPRLCEVGASDEAAMNLLNNFGGMLGRALLRSHLDQLAVFL